jgi:hypothetical protein
VENCFSTGISTGTGSDTVNGTGKRISVGTKENKEGWPLLTLETEANGDLRGTYKRGSFLCWFVGLVTPVQEIFVLPWLLSPVQNIVFLTAHYFTSYGFIAQQAGQAVVPRHLSLNRCLWLVFIRSIAGKSTNRYSSSCEPRRLRKSAGGR